MSDMFELKSFPNSHSKLTTKLLDDNQNEEIGVSNIYINETRKTNNNYYNQVLKYHKKTIVIMSIIFFLTSAILFYGFLQSNSMSILTESLHTLSDLLGLILTLISDYYFHKQPNKVYTFGYCRAEIILSLVSTFIILLFTFNLLVNSIHMLYDEHHTIKPYKMLIYSTIGIVLNMIITFIIRYRKSLINIQSIDDSINSKIPNKPFSNYYTHTKSSNNIYNFHNIFIRNCLINKDQNIYFWNQGMSILDKQIKLCNFANYSSSSPESNNMVLSKISEKLEENDIKDSINNKITNNNNITEADNVNKYSDKSMKNSLIGQEKASNILSKLSEGGKLHKSKSHVNLIPIAPTEKFIMDKDFNFKRGRSQFGNNEINHGYNICADNDNKSYKSNNIYDYDHNAYDGDAGQLSSPRKSKLYMNKYPSYKQKEFAMKEKKYDYINKLKQPSEFEFDRYLKKKKEKENLIEIQNNSRNKSNFNLDIVIQSIGDLIQSLVILCCSVIIFFFPEFQFLDRIITIVFSVLVTLSAWPFILQSTDIIMEGRPTNIEYNKVLKTLENVNGVLELKCLHIWSITISMSAVDTKVLIMSDIDGHEVIKDIRSILLHKFNFAHVNIEILKKNFTMFKEYRCTS